MNYNTVFKLKIRMDRIINTFINLPEYIVKEICRFLIPDSSTIRFCVYKKTKPNCYYNLKYERAFIGGNIVKNNKGLFLSRIVKKNGKYRYYITEEFIDCIHVEHNDRIYPQYMYEYSSTYVGKDINDALVRLFVIQM